MAGSQLKRLKSSLREQGVIGPQQSKKQKRKSAQDLKARNDKRLQRTAVLENIREQFNPFQFKTNARGPKFDVTTNQPAGDKARGIHGRPGLSRSLGEEKRRKTLLVEMQRRNKIGGILDRRFGEDDPNMTPEEKMLERFAREKQRNYKNGGSLFDLEDEETIGGLTHMGRSLSFDEVDAAAEDDLDESDLDSGAESDLSAAQRRRLKRMRREAPGEGEGEGEDGNRPENGEPERKKTKKEVMEEIIAKSKHHKYERQAAKEEDDDLRAEIDKELPGLRYLLFQRERPGPDTARDGQGDPLIAGIEKSAMEKDYDLRLRQMIQDKRAAPSSRTKTEEEKAGEESKRLQELEEKRLKRMRGEQVSDEEEGSTDDERDAGKGPAAADPASGFDGEEGEEDEEDEDEFGLGKGVKMRPTATELGFDDEDDFVIDDDLVASGSDLELDEDESGEESGSEAEEEAGSESDDEFTKGLLTDAESRNILFKETGKTQGDDEDGVPYTFPCPQTHAEMLETFRSVPLPKLTTAVQRIRALHHPKLDSGNKERLGNFSRALVRHVAHLAATSAPEPPMAVLEGLVRHVHSLAKTFPIEVAKEYRAHIEEMGRERPLSPDVGDLVILTAVGTTFPTSDHFHQVVTPAILSIARYLGQKVPETLADHATGAYLSILALEYQKLSRRYVPELINFTLNTLCALAPERLADKPGFFPVHEPAPGTRMRKCQAATPRKLTLADCRAGGRATTAAGAARALKASILAAATSVVRAAADAWAAKPAFLETFEPARRVLEHLTSAGSRGHLPAAAVAGAEQASAQLARAARAARLARRPLELHHHRPRAIRTQVPKFEQAFDPGRHYDPDRARAEQAKLRAEHRRERKGALRELRRDASFVAREGLRRKKERDEAYERKYRRLVAEIQSQEGRAANEYDREKEARRRAGKRG